MIRNSFGCSKWAGLRAWKPEASSFCGPVGGDRHSSKLVSMEMEGSGKERCQITVLFYQDVVTNQSQT